tara:strand:- start:1405 stop:1839 length:435 start_codon:yes stop_codon:yes gene_type:complete
MNFYKCAQYIIFLSIFVLNTAFAEVKNASNEEIVALMRAGVPLVDVRTYKEWKKTGIIKNSNLLTFFDQNGNSNVENWMHELRKIASKNQPVIILCRSGKRSGIVSNILSEKMQYSKVYNANSGILGWINGGQETTMDGLSSEN